MNRDEFEDGLLALGFEMDEDGERWVRPADALNAPSHIAFASVRGLLYFGNSVDTYQVLLDSVDSTIHEPGADAGLLVGGETLCRQR